ncbi:MAG: hypothetical protein V3R25_00980 [Nitrosomonadaceae bacterium]
MSGGRSDSKSGHAKNAKLVGRIGLDHGIGHFEPLGLIAGALKRPIPLVFKLFRPTQRQMGWPTP